MQAHDGMHQDAPSQRRLDSKQSTHQGGPHGLLAVVGQNEGGLVGDQVRREALGTLWWRGPAQQRGRAAPADGLAAAGDAVGCTGGAGAGGAAGFVGRAGLLGWVGWEGRAGMVLAPKGGFGIHRGIVCVMQAVNGAQGLRKPPLRRSCRCDKHERTLMSIPGFHACPSAGQGLPIWRRAPAAHMPPTHRLDSRGLE